MGGTPKTALPPQDRAASLGYAEIAEWTPLEATDTPGEVITTMTKYWLLP